MPPLKQGDRVVVTRGAHTGCVGTIIARAGDVPAYDARMKLAARTFVVSLDAGGVPITVAADEVTEGPP